MAENNTERGTLTTGKDHPVKCDFCAQTAVQLTGESNESLVCSAHASNDEQARDGIERLALALADEDLPTSTPNCGGGPAVLSQLREERVVQRNHDKTPTLAEALDRIMGELHDLIMDRHRKYGPGNIAKHGPTGIHVRMDDKFSRLEAGLENHDDETVENTLMDICGYSLIWMLWLRGQWPGSV